MLYEKELSNLQQCAKIVQKTIKLQQETWKQITPS